ncbi:hypothetical protein, partial [Staphylococcus aureus]
SCAAPSAKGDDKFITTDYLQQCPQVQQRGTGQRIDQQVEVAAIPVGAMQHRAEDARVRGAKAAYRFTHCASLHVKHNRRSHAHPFLSKLVE